LGIGLLVAGSEWALFPLGPNAKTAVLAGCGISWVSSVCGAIPLARAFSKDPRQAGLSVMASTAVRFLVVLIAAAPLALMKWFPNEWFLGSLGVSYVLMLVMDTYLAVRWIRKTSEAARP